MTSLPEVSMLQRLAATVASLPDTNIEIERRVVERVLKLLGVEHVSADSIRHVPR